MASRDKRARMEALAAARGGTKKDYTKLEDTAIYDTVTDEDYRAIVKGRLQQDDFIDDDDGSGYVDQGVDDWERAQSSGESSNGGKPGKSKTKPKPKSAKGRAPAAEASAAPKKKPVLRKAGGAAALGVAPSLSDYRKPKPSVGDGDDFMESLLGNLDSAPIPSTSWRSDSRKRKSSPDFGVDEYPFRKSATRSKIPRNASSSSVGSEAHVDFGAGASSDGMGEFEEVEDRGMKKPRLSGVEAPMGEMIMGPDFSTDLGMDIDDDLPPILPSKPLQAKQEDENEDDDLALVKHPDNPPPRSRRPRQLVNATATRNQPKVEEASGPQALDKKPVGAPKPKPKGMDWQAALDDLSTASISLVDPSEPVLKSDPSDAETTEFLANLPRKPTIAQARAAAKATAAAEAELAKPGGPGVNQVAAMEEDGSLRFFWLDFVEIAGVVHLFGKVWNRNAAVGKGKWTSCVVSVEGIERNVYFLPRDTVVDEDGDENEPTEDDIYDDIEEVLKSANITEFKSKTVTRKYAFEIPGIPAESDKWNKISYSFAKPVLPMDLKGKTFSRVLGTNTSAFELFLLKRKIMGPCWLEIKGATISQAAKAISWCRLEIVVKDPKTINPFSESDPDAPKDTPPLTILSLSVRDIVNHKENKREIVCATLRIWNDANLDDTTPIEKQPSTVKALIRPLGSFPKGFEDECRNAKTKIMTFKNEQMLLSNLLGTLSQHDPDILVGHELAGSALDVILQRMKDLKTVHWSRIGRFRRDKLPQLRAGGFNSYLTTGRLLCDLMSDGSKSMISSTTWSLTEICLTHLKIARDDIDPDDTADYFDDTAATPQKLLLFARHCMADSMFQMQVAFKVQLLPLTKQLTNLAGNAWSQTLVGMRAQRNEYILLHEFHRQKYICPDKLSFSDRKHAKAMAEAADNGDEVEGGKKGGKKDKYKGGLVFEPQRGLWDKYILVMDFNSLYPSIIQEFNIDFTTVDRSGDHANDINWLPEVPAGDIKQGVLPRLIATLVQRRRQVKTLMKDRDTTPAKLLQYDIKQLALKLTANSMYGCLGFDGSRFYAPSLAALTTSKGREILTSTKELAENQQLDVVYGDTDSVMINTNATDLDLAKQIGNEFKKLVNERYRLLEIDIDAIFQRMLLLQKKKYAALKVEDNNEKVMEIKGLDMKRREFCELSKSTSQFILNQILSGDATETVVTQIHDYLTSVGQRIRAGEIPLDDFIIFKRLGKNPQDYPDAKSQPHVQVALRMKSKGGGSKAGDVIPYIFCLGEDGVASKSAQADKARHPDDFRRADSKLKIDYDYYLSAQVLPPVERLCDPIEGTDRPRLAECLGLDPDRFRTTIISGGDNEREFHTLDSQIPDSERFRESASLHLRCRHCKEEVDFKGLQGDQSKIICTEGFICPNIACALPFGVPSIAVQLENNIRSHIGRFYEGWLVCDDASCRHRTRMMSVYGKRCLNVSIGCKGAMNYEYADTALYNQLLYFDAMFDPDKARNTFRGTPKFEEVHVLLEKNKATLAQLRAVVTRYLERNGRRYVSMSALFSFMRL